MRAVLVVNPVKVDDVERLRARVDRAGRRYGWQAADVVPTTQDDPGEGMARAAVRDGADLVLAAGGDGTVMSVARGLAHSGVPLGVLPVGTGNLLARNLDLPLDLDEALEVALCGRSRTVDLGRAGAPGRPGDGFTVMAGLGFDAAMMTDAPERLKASVGWPAYVLSGARHLRDRAVRLELCVDGGPPRTRSARAVIAGNVGTLQAGLRLMPDARPDDGLLDVVVLSPRGVLDWVRVVARLLARRPGDGPHVERFQARRVELTVSRPQPSQLDGDPAGDVTRLLLEVDPGALVVRVPR